MDELVRFADKDCSAQERASMPGLLHDTQTERLRANHSAGLDELFRLMIFHHAGAVRMANDELRNGSDPRLRVMAQAIRHEQQGEIALMNCAAGREAVLIAVRNIFADNVNGHLNSKREFPCTFCF